MGYGLNLLVMYPGMMMWDSIDQLLQARSGEFNDWHPPVMSFIWRWLDMAVAGPFPMLAVQLGLLWAGGWLVVRIAGSGSAAMRIAVLFVTFFFPPVACVMGFITKDAILAGVLLVAFGLVGMLQERGELQRRSRSWFVAGVAVLVGCLVLAAALRYNAIGGVWAVSGCAIHALAFRPPRLIRSLGLGLIAAVACTAVATPLNGLLTTASEEPWQSVAAYDIAGVARELGGLDFIAEADRKTLGGDAAGGEWTMDRMEKGRRDWNHMLAAGLHVEPSPTLKRVWRESIRNHPRAYLAHRLKAFGRNLSFAGEAVSQCVGLQPYTDLRELDEQAVAVALRHDYKLSPLQKWLKRSIVWLAFQTILFCPGVYLGLALVALIWGTRPLTRGNPLPFFLALSGLAQQATLFFLAPAVNYRYSHWLVTSAWLAMLLLASDAVVAAATLRRAQA